MKLLKNALAWSALSLSSLVWADYAYNFPTPVTPLARETLEVHNLFMIVILVLFFGVFAVMLYSFIKHAKARGHQASNYVGPRSRKQWLLTLIPFAGLLFLDYGVFGIPAYHAVLTYEDTKNDSELVVKVTGQQWMWIYEYPADGVQVVSRLTTPREQIDNLAPKGEHYLLEVDNPLVIPAGKKIRFVTTSNDVIHIWWVPAFGVGRDAVPGFLREFWVKADEPGIYRGQCGQLCGKEHGFMPAVVKVVSDDEFKAFIKEHKAPVAGAPASGSDKVSAVQSAKLAAQ